MEKTIIKSPRSSYIELSKEHALIRLDERLNMVGEPNIVTYKEDDSLNSIFAVGVKDGSGRDSYRVISIGKCNVIWGVLTAKPGSIKKGEVYLYHPNQNSPWYTLDSTLIEKIVPEKTTYFDLNTGTYYLSRNTGIIRTIDNFFTKTEIDDIIKSVSAEIVQANWEETNPASGSYIANKPTKFSDFVVDISLTLKKLDTPEAGYESTYRLVKNESEYIGESINIPKDIKVIDCEVKEVEESDKEEGGKFYDKDEYEIGDKYFQFTTSDDKFIYILAKSLTDIYTPGTNITIDNKKITGTVVSGNGLYINSEGQYCLDKATTETPGAMSAEDKTKLDSLHLEKYAKIEDLENGTIIAKETESTKGIVAQETDKVQLDSPGFIIRPTGESYSGIGAGEAIIEKIEGRETPFKADELKTVGPNAINLNNIKRGFTINLSGSITSSSNKSVVWFRCVKGDRSITTFDLKNNGYAITAGDGPLGYVGFKATEPGQDTNRVDSIIQPESTIFNPELIHYIPEDNGWLMVTVDNKYLDKLCARLSWSGVYDRVFEDYWEDSTTLGNHEAVRKDDLSDTWKNNNGNLNFEKKYGKGENLDWGNILTDEGDQSAGSMKMLDYIEGDGNIWAETDLERGESDNIKVEIEVENIESECPAPILGVKNEKAYGTSLYSEEKGIGVSGDCDGRGGSIAELKSIKGNTIVWNQLLGEGKYVDMGLPSGTIWATCNIDTTQEDGFAASPFQYECSFFSWGNIKGYNPVNNSFAGVYNWGGVNSAEPWYEGQPYGDTPGNTLTMNIPVGDTYDAARYNVGNLWQIPSNTQFQELIDNCIFIDADGNEVNTSETNKIVRVNGIMGLYLQSKTNGNRLFFSASGFGNESSWSFRGAGGLYWSTSFVSSRFARYLLFSSDGGGVNPQNYNNRCFGNNIRAVFNPTDVITIGHNNHKYYIKDNKNIFDLTLMFGSNNEPTIEEFNTLFPNSYYPYNEGELISLFDGLKSFNVWDEEWELGSINNNDGEKIFSDSIIRSKNYIRVFPNTSYSTNGIDGYVFEYDKNKQFIQRITNYSVFTTSQNCAYILFRNSLQYGNTYNHDICISISNPAYNGTYLPYGESLPAGIKSVGFNQWDEEYGLGYYNENGEWTALNSTFGCHNLIRVIPDTDYYITIKKLVGTTVPYGTMNFRFFDRLKNQVGHSDAINTTFHTPSKAYYIAFNISTTYYSRTYLNDICINFSDPSRNGTYEPYKSSILYFNGEEGSIATLTGKPEGSVSSEVIFPEGMKSAGTVYDELTGLENGYFTKAIKRIGSVDLGTLTWTIPTGNPVFRTKSLESLMKQPPSAGIVCNVICARYSSVNYGNGEGRTDKAVNGTWATAANSWITITDTSYTDVATFKTAMSGVMLYYELATPITYTLDTPVPATYYVNSYGTEELLPINPPSFTPITAPFNGVINYGYSTSLPDTTITNLVYRKTDYTPTDSELSTILSSNKSIKQKLNLTITPTTLNSLSTSVYNKFSIFGQNNLRGRMSSGKIYSIRIYNNSNTLLHNLIPAVNPDTNSPSLYDTVDSKFLNLITHGTSSFSYGNELKDIALRLIYKGSTSSVKLSAVLPSRLWVDGFEYTPSLTWTFGDTDFHEVMMQFNTSKLPIQAFYGIDSLVSVIIPSSITDIYYDAFMGCTNLSSVIIGASVTSINAGVFRDCENLTSITLLSTNPPEIEYNTLPQNATYYVPDSSVTLYREAEFWSNVGDKIQANPRSTRYFYQCSDLVGDIMPGTKYIIGPDNISCNLLGVLEADVESSSDPAPTGSIYYELKNPIIYQNVGKSKIRVSDYGISEFIGATIPSGPLSVLYPVDLYDDLRNSDQYLSEKLEESDISTDINSLGPVQNKIIKKYIDGIIEEAGNYLVKDLSRRDIYGNILSTRNTANCYVVSEPSFYRIPLVYGNAIKNGEPNPSSYTNNGGNTQADFVNYLGNPITSPYIEIDTRTDASIAKLIWCDHNNLVTDINLSSGNPCRFINFTVNNVPEEGANAVIGIIDKTNSVMWSWHIWITPENLQPVEIWNSIPELGPTGGTRYEIMPINLGWTSTRYGTFYQWGRKDPFPGSPSNSEPTIYGGTLVKTSGGTVTGGIKNPLTFYTGDNWNELTHYYNFWDSLCYIPGVGDNATIKTIYDPCPYEWKVPGGAIFKGFTTTGSNSSEISEFNITRDFNQGWTFKRSYRDIIGIFFPASGYRDCNSGSPVSVSTYGYYWTSASYSPTHSYGLSFYNNGVYPTYNSYKSNGFSIRPVKE